MSGSYVFDASIPSYVSLRKIHSNKFHSLIKAEITYASYYDHNQDDVLEITGSEVGIFLEYNVFSYVWLNVGGSYVDEKQLTWLKSDDNFATIESGYKLSGAVRVRF